MLRLSTHGHLVPADYEECGECGYDHDYEYEQAVEWHKANPCSYCPYTNGQHTHNCPTVTQKVA